MSAYDIVRSFAESREDSSIAIRDGITYGAARELADEIMRLRAEAKAAASLRTLLAECRPSMVEYRKRVEQDLTNAAYFPGRYPETLKALNTERDICDALLDRIDAAIGAER